MIRVISLALLQLLAFSLLTGCDFSARSDLKAADKAMKEADKWHAEEWAEREYRKAQSALIEAMDFAKVNLVNEARDKAAESRGWSEEAIELSRKRQEEMEKEHDRLGGYKP